MKVQGRVVRGVIIRGRGKQRRIMYALARDDKSWFKSQGVLWVSKSCRARCFRDKRSLAYHRRGTGERLCEERAWDNYQNSCLILAANRQLSLSPGSWIFNRAGFLNLVMSTEEKQYSWHCHTRRNCNYMCPQLWRERHVKDTISPCQLLTRVRILHHYTLPSKHETLNHCWFNVGPAS